jgi:mannose-6-phosphate isomerase-like protein (cupin superfamily)
MHEKIKQVADRVRELREIFRVTAETLAKEIHLEVDEYRRYESGTEDIPVGVLYQIASHFNIELSSLITGEEPKLHSYCLTRAGKRAFVDRREAYKYEELASNFIRKKAEPFLVTVEPAPGNAPEHFNSHPGQEFNYVLEGTLRVVLDKHELILEAGDSLYFDSGVPHGMKALNGKPAKFLAVIL